MDRYGLPTSTTREEADRNATIAVLPVGSYEQHGDYLPLSTDILIANIVATEVAQAYGLMLLPPITISCSHEHAGWRGTVSISARTLHAVITDIAESLRLSGVERLLLISGHGGNYVLSNVVQEASVHGPRMALFPSGSEWNRAREAAGLDVLDGHADMHAGELETSILLHAMPDVVRAGYETADHEAERPELLTRGMRAYTTSGVVGRPSLGTAEKGKAVLDVVTRLASTHVTALSA